MEIKELLKEKKQTILDAWFDCIIKTYPEDSSSFLKGQKNRFANPVGYTIRKEAEALLDDFFAKTQPDSLMPHIDNILRIRAVQDFAPDEAVGFIFFLKDVLRSALKEELAGEGSLSDQLYRLDSEIDRMALIAFRLYVSCREKLYELRIKEISARTERLMKRFGAKYSMPEEHAEA